MKTVCRYVTALPLVAMLSMARAELPLTVEGLITDKGQLKLDISLSYANSYQRGITTGEPITIQTGPTSFVELPTAIGEEQGNNDTLVGTLGVRYGLVNKTEFYIRGSYLYSDARTHYLNESKSDSDSRFIDAWAGVNYQFKQNNDTPAVLGFAEVALREKYRESSVSFKSWMMGVTAYAAIDPIVFSFTSAYRVSQHREGDGTDYKPGNLLILNPSVAFAVNDRVTLTTGWQWVSRWAASYNGQSQGLRRTDMDLQLGTGYGISKVSTLTLTFTTNASGQEGADLRLNWLHTI